MNTQNKNRKSFNDSLNILSTNGFKSVWNEEEYHLKFTTVKSEIPVICVNCKDESLKSLFNINRGSKCKKCAQLLKYKTVNDEFIKNGIKLLWNEDEFSQNFTGGLQKIPAICICGEKKELCYSRVRIGGKCQDCGKEKIRNTNLERYGFENPFSNKEVKDKIRNTNLERYGFENPSSNEEVKDKIRNTNLERYGFENSLQNEEVRDKIRNTNLERYGFESPFPNEEVKEKIRNTNLERYGFENPSSNEEVKDKIRNTNLERYGFENPLSNEEVKDKIRNTNLERYGFENPFQNILMRRAKVLYVKEKLRIE
jgi:hypothetical protein